MGGRGSSSATSKTADKKHERVKASFIGVIHEKGSDSIHIQKADEYYKTKNQFISDARGNGFVVDAVFTPQELQDYIEGGGTKYKINYETETHSQFARKVKMQDILSDLFGNYSLEDLIYLGERNYL